MGRRVQRKRNTPLPIITWEWPTPSWEQTASRGVSLTLIRVSPRLIAHFLSTALPVLVSRKGQGTSPQKAISGDHTHSGPIRCFIPKAPLPGLILPTVRHGQDFGQDSGHVGFNMTRQGGSPAHLRTGQVNQPMTKRHRQAWPLPQEAGRSRSFREVAGDPGLHGSLDREPD